MDRFQDEQEEAQAAQAQGVAHLHGVALHLHWVEVVQHAVHDHVGPVAGAVGVALAENRTRVGRSTSRPASPGPGRRSWSSGRSGAPAAAPCALLCRWPLVSFGSSLGSRRAASRSRSRGSWFSGEGRPPGEGSPILPRMMTPVGQRSTHRAQRVHTSSSIVKITLSAGSIPGSSVPTASSTASVVTMKMHFHGADVHAALAHDALRLVDVDELLGLDRLREPGRVHLLEHVVVPELRHGRVGVGGGHASDPSRTRGRPKLDSSAPPRRPPPSCPGSARASTAPPARRRRRRRSRWR